MNIKGLMIVVFFISAMLAAPTFAMGQDEEDGTADGTGDDLGMYQGFMGGFGAMFGNLGYGGQVIGKVFTTLFMQGLELQDHETLESVYVMSANSTETYNGTVNLGGEEKTYMLPGNYDNGTYKYVYCKETGSGTVNYTLTQGAGITLIIWDNDKSFINAAQKVIDLINKVIEAEENNESMTEEQQQALIEEAASTLSWFLIHINDIFTGDELFILNPITWQNLELDPSDDYYVNHNWYGSDDNSLNPSGDVEILPSDQLWNNWEVQANASRNSQMQFLTKDIINPSDVQTTLWTQFSFDLIQLWIKNFEIHIDVSAFLDGEDMNPADAFSGCDIEFFLFNHHLSGAFLYNDTNNDDVLSAEYKEITYTDESGNETTGDVPTSSEVTHRLMLGDVNSFEFQKPKINEEDSKISWGLTLRDLTMSAIPIGVDLNKYLSTEKDNLDFIYFGYQFIPNKDDSITTEDGSVINVASGDVKVEHNFAPWNGGSGPTQDINGLDMAILYTSSVLHFHLNIENTAADPEDPEALLGQEDYNNEEKKLQIGNYLDPNVEANLDFVDIAGPGYTMSNGSDSDDNPNGEFEQDYDATTNTIPVALWTGEKESHETYTGDNNTVDDDFASDVRVTAEFQVLLYAVCYPDFGDHPGAGIWHDPTFSVYMVFEATGFWALILLVAGIGLVGVATIFIKKRKDARI